MVEDACELINNKKLNRKPAALSLDCHIGSLANHWLPPATDIIVWIISTGYHSRV